MAYPVIYNVTYSYTGFQIAQGNNSFPGTQIDSDLQGLRSSVSNLALFTQSVMRSDGALNNGIVTFDSLSPALRTAGLAPATLWLTATAYAAGASVVQSSTLYRCLVAHTSGVFATDLAAAKWLLVTALPAGANGTNGTNGTNGAGYGGTSATSLLIANSVTKVFTTQAGLAYPASGGYVRASSAANGANFMEGLATYSGTTMSIAVTAIGGSGTFADWAFASAGIPGAVAFAVAPQGRLSLTSGTAITTSNVTGATLAFYMPAAGGFVPVWNGSAFQSLAFTQLSNDTTQSATLKAGPAAVAASSMYDFYVWSDSGTLRLTRSPAWTSDTSRGTGAGTAEVDFTTIFPTNKNAITNGPAAGFGTLVGSVRSDGSSQLKDTNGFRWVSNLYNAVPRFMSVTEATASWAYTTAAYRQANGAAANQLDFIQCGSGGMLSAHVNGNSSNTNTGVIQVAGIGIDQFTVNNANTWAVQNSPTANAVMPLAADYLGHPGIGRHFAAWLEYSAATGTTTWYSALSAGVTQTGISGWINN